MGAGDGYNRRFDAVLEDFSDKERCVDDTIFWDADLEKHWWRTIEFLETVSKSGIVLNPEKFQFCAKAIEMGVEIFDPRLHTCPQTDWSMAGMGYYLCQKVCGCKGADLACCTGGWRICLAGSRFNLGAESR